MVAIFAQRERGAAQHAAQSAQLTDQPGMVERRVDELDNERNQYRQENDQFRTHRVVMDASIRELEPTFGVLKTMAGPWSTC